MNKYRSALVALTLLGLIACASVSIGGSGGKLSLADVVNNSSHRSDKNIKRDEYRNPSKTLAFFDVKPDHHVVEVWPGSGGWYTEILAPYLKNNGKLYAAHFSPDSPVAYFRKSLAKFNQKITQNPDIFEDVVVSVLQPGVKIEVAPAASVDRVLTFRNVHNWVKGGYEQRVFDEFYDILKPGGLLGIVEHRATPGTALKDMISSGYMTEAAVKDYAAKAGFEFVDSSEINANTSDTTNHPKGVWSLPPTLRLGEQDRDYYLSIGESDRMTLLFKKPNG